MLWGLHGGGSFETEPARQVHAAPGRGASARRVFSACPAGSGRAAGASHLIACSYSLSAGHPAVESFSARVYKPAYFPVLLVSTLTMPPQEHFAVEQFMDKYETSIVHNLGETCCYLMLLQQVQELSGVAPPMDTILTKRLTYGWIFGSEQLRGQVAELYATEAVGAEQVVVSNGAIGANFLALYALMGPGDHCIVVDPTYQQLQLVPAMFGAEVLLLRLDPASGWLPDVAELQRLVRPNTKLIVVNNPNNPLGAVMDNALMQRVVDVAALCDAYLLCDEVYRPMFYAGVEEPKLVVEMYAKGIATLSMSKAWSAAGIRLGWVVLQDEAFLAACRLRRDYNTIAVLAIDDIIAQYLLQQRGAILEWNKKMVADNLATFAQFVEESKGALEWVKPSGGTVVFVKVNGLPGDDTELFCGKLAEEYKTLAAPGECFNRKGYLRIGLGNSPEDLAGGLPQLKQALVDAGVWA